MMTWASTGIAECQAELLFEQAGYSTGMAAMARSGIIISRQSTTMGLLD
jgi:hypothetical protein